MNQLACARASTTNLPALVATSGDQASRRFLEFFASNIRNRNIRLAYSHAVGLFLDWCEDRARLGLTVYSFARIGAALSMKVEDVYSERRRLWVHLREKGGKRHEMPCHHNLEAYLTAYIEGAGIADDLKGPLFRTIGRGTGQLTRTPLPRANVYMMVQRRSAAAGLETKIGNHSFRATGITAYLKNGGTLEKTASMANHASTAPPSSTIDVPMRSLSMKSSGWGFNAFGSRSDVSN